ncbi:MAG: hypothetical protein R6U17_08140 [Thermoplasmata archaeon]
MRYMQISQKEGKCVKLDRGKLTGLLAVVLLVSGILTSGCLNGYDELILTEVMFVEDHEVENYDSLVETEPVYEPSDIVYMGFEVEGFEADDGIIEWTIYQTLTDPQGNVYPGADNVNVRDRDEEIDANWGIIVDFPQLYPPEDGWDEGENQITFLVTDNVGDKELEFTKTFRVEMP